MVRQAHHAAHDEASADECGDQQPIFPLLLVEIVLVVDLQGRLLYNRVAGVHRAIFDLGILIEATPENAQRLLDALLEARLGTAALISAQGILAHEITGFKR